MLKDLQDVLQAKKNVIPNLIKTIRAAAAALAWLDPTVLDESNDGRPEMYEPPNRQVYISFLRMCNDLEELQEDDILPLMKENFSPKEFFNLEYYIERLCTQDLAIPAHQLHSYLDTFAEICRISEENIDGATDKSSRNVRAILSRYKRNLGRFTSPRTNAEEAFLDFKHALEDLDGFHDACSTVMIKHKTGKAPSQFLTLLRKALLENSTQTIHDATEEFVEDRVHYSYAFDRRLRRYDFIRELSRLSNYLGNLNRVFNNDDLREKITAIENDAAIMHSAIEPLVIYGNGFVLRDEHTFDEKDIYLAFKRELPSLMRDIGDLIHEIRAMYNISEEKIAFPDESGRVSEPRTTPERAFLNLRHMHENMRQLWAATQPSLAVYEQIQRRR